MSAADGVPMTAPEEVVGSGESSTPARVVITFSCSA